MARTEPKPDQANPSFPNPAKPPTLVELNIMLSELAKVPTYNQAKEPLVIPLNDDWRTQGTYIDRYCRFAGVLCAMAGGGVDIPDGDRGEWLSWQGWIGRNCRKGDQIRRWVHWITTDNPRALQSPMFGGRKQSEWDDHGETYPMSQDGPHLYGTIRLPRGEYILSLYFFNKDGHTGNNRWRDYLVDVRWTPMPEKLYHTLGQAGVDAETIFEKATPQARLRVQEFWGGVYKRFYVSVPEKAGYYTIRVNRDYSFNTILSAIMIDPAGELCGPRGPFEEPPTFRVPPHGMDLGKSGSDLEDVASRLLDHHIMPLRDCNCIWYYPNSRRFLIPLVKRLLEPEGPGDRLAARIDKSGKYEENLRSDLAACLHDLQMFERRDTIFIPEKTYASFRYLKTSQFGMKKWEWDWAALSEET